MSYPVRVVVKQTVSETLSSADEVRLALCDDPVLANPNARDLLRARLEAHGWEATEGDGTEFRKTLDDGVEAVWNLDDNAVVIRAGGEHTIEREESVTRHGDAWKDADRPAIERELRERAEKELADKARVSDDERDAARAQLEETLAEQLEAHVPLVQREVADIQEDFYREWLKREAAKLGNIMSIHESETADGSVFELTIRVDQAFLTGP